MYAASRARVACGAERLRWQAQWWRVHAEESASPLEPLQYAENLEEEAEQYGSR